MAKKTVMVFCGGPSAEHEISLISALGIVTQLRKKHDVHVVGITRDAEWRYYGPGMEFTNGSLDPRTITLASGEACHWDISPKGGLSLAGKTLRPDVCFPIIHSLWGEDGKIQTLIEMAELPFVGVGLDAASASLNKDFTKRILKSGGVPVVPSETFYEDQPWDEVCSHFPRIWKEFGKPVFVKPATQGSSVGVYRVTNEGDLERRVREAFTLDRSVLVEKAVVGRELEISVLGYKKLVVSNPGEIILKAADFYTYDAKYIHPEKVETRVNTPINPKLQERMKAAAALTFRLLNCEGIARIDFLVEADETEFYVNEVNTMPGFTPISMYPKMLEAVGFSYGEILERLLHAAQDAHLARKARLKTTIAWRPK